MAESSKIFRFNPFNLIVPGIFFLAALIIKSQIQDLKILYYILLSIGLLSSFVLAGSYTTLIITERELGVKKLWKSRVIRLEEIIAKKKETRMTKGVESFIWELFLKDGEKVIIHSDPFWEVTRLKEALNWFLRNIPRD